MQFNTKTNVQDIKLWKFKVTSEETKNKATTKKKEITQKHFKIQPQLHVKTT